MARGGVACERGGLEGAVGERGPGGQRSSGAGVHGRFGEPCRLLVFVFGVALYDCVQRLTAGVAKAGAWEILRIGRAVCSRVRR